MKSFFPKTLIIFCLVLGCTAGAYAQAKSDGPLTNAEIMKLVKAGFKEKTIVLIIAARVPNFDLSPDRMIQLKRNGVSENIIVAMLARQEGNDPAAADDGWGDDPFFDNVKSDPKMGAKGGGGGESAAEKIEALRSAGIIITPSPAELGSTMLQALGKAAA